MTIQQPVKDDDMTQPKQTDESLMQSYAKGDIASFEVLYGRHKDALYRYFVRQISDLELAHDVYQECWGRIIKSAGSYTPESKWTSWAYRIAHNLVVDHYRRFQPVEVDEETGSKSFSPDKLHNQALVSKQLKHCMEKLPSVQLEVFLLSQETDLTMNMISDVVDASYEAVKTRMRYARTALQQCLGKFGISASSSSGLGGGE